MQQLGRVTEGRAHISPTDHLRWKSQNVFTLKAQVEGDGKNVRILVSFSPDSCARMPLTKQSYKGLRSQNITDRSCILNQQRGVKFLSCCRQRNPSSFHTGRSVKSASHFSSFLFPHLWNIQKSEVEVSNPANK